MEACEVIWRFLPGARFLLPVVAQAPGVNWQKPSSRVHSTPRFLAAQRSAVSSLGEEVAQREPLKGLPLDSFPNRGARPLWHPGAARYGWLYQLSVLRTFEYSIVGGTTNLADPTRRKANFLWKFLCAGDFPLCDEDPRPPSKPAPQGFLQSKNALRRTNATKFAARQKDR